jgi:hypothetical protein
MTTGSMIVLWMKGDVMEVCSNDHDEIVYHNSYYGGCPLCKANEIIDEIQKDLNEMEGLVEQLTEISQLKEESLKEERNERRN